MRIHTSSGQRVKIISRETSYDDQVEDQGFPFAVLSLAAVFIVRRHELAYCYRKVEKYLSDMHAKHLASIGKARCWEAVVGY